MPLPELEAMQGCIESCCKRHGVFTHSFLSLIIYIHLQALLLFFCGGGELCEILPCAVAVDAMFGQMFVTSFHSQVMSGYAGPLASLVTLFNDFFVSGMRP
jgi:ribonuclease BN (tRNA processing enzyme)